MAGGLSSIENQENGGTSCRDFSSPRDGGLGPWKMSEAETTDDGVKGTTCEWEMFDVGFTKFEGWERTCQSPRLMSA
jgi:hypothetical protein